jgi:heme exporter protein C
MNERATPTAPRGADAPGSPATPAPLSTSSRGTRILGALSLVGLVAVVLFSFVFSKPDVELGESIRIMYVHVGSVTAAYCLMVASAGFSIFAMWKRSQFSDLAAHATAEVATLLLALTLIVGAIWGRMTWGVFWTWDARLTSTAILFLMYVGYLAVRSLPASPRARAVRSGVVNLLAAAMIPVVRESVNWWASLHQQKTALGTLDPSISGLQYFTLMLSMVVFGLVAVWLTMHRFRLAWLEDHVADVGLDAAIEARRSEAVGVAS